MIGKFWMMTLLLCLLIAGAWMHYVGYDRERVDNAVLAVADLSRMPYPSFGVSYLEPDAIKHFQGFSQSHANVAYPEMAGIDRMDFVYAK